MKVNIKEKEVLLEVKNLKKYFKINNKSCLKAVDDVSFIINRGETFGLVGESGCGKSTIGRTIIKLYDLTDGEINFDGRKISSMDEKAFKTYRKRIQMIFQDPYASLNPRMTVADIIGEPLYIHKLGNEKERQKRILKLLSMVGLSKEHVNRYPHEFSGGQRQRIGIARALSVNADLLICDEPISALDVSIQAQIINMLEDLQKEMNLTYLFIAHDLSMVKYISDRIGVMYLGKLFEVSESNSLFDNPIHPYTQALISSMPSANINKNSKRIILEGEVPSPINMPSGCRFRTRCRQQMDICSIKEPMLKDIGDNHFVSCHLIDKGVQLKQIKNL